MTEKSATTAPTDETAAATPSATATLLVIYTEQLETCRAFYAELGVPLVREQHGSGPVHYAADLDGLTLELYPGTAGRATGRLGLGLILPTGPDQTPGQQQHTDPDGRVVVLQLTTPRWTAASPPQRCVQR